MRLALKHQILLAPAAVLTLMALLLGFLQYTYWDLSVKRQEARKLSMAFIALAEADLSSQAMQGITLQLQQDHYVDISKLEAITQFHSHLAEAVDKIITYMRLPSNVKTLLRQSVDDLDPDNGLNSKKFLSALSLLRPQLISLVDQARQERTHLGSIRSQDIDDLVARTTMVSLIVLSAAILLGTFLALFFARRILHRIQFLSDSAGRVARGELVLPPAPAKVQDELDDLATSISSMTERLIRVVGSEKLLEGAEEERRRIAMDLHDQTLSDLSAVLRGIQVLNSEGECGPQGAKLEEDLQRTMTNLREIMDNLHPQTLDILGLGAALQSHLERHLSRGDLPEFHIYLSPEAEALDLSRPARLNIYRIAVEALHNVIKHARASRYEVTLDQRDQSVVLSVEDNGIGFTEPPEQEQHGRGLNNIRERAKAIGARVSWRPSRFTSGTRFELILPLCDNHSNGTTP